MHLGKLIPILALAITVAGMPVKNMGIDRGDIEFVSEEDINAESEAEQSDWTSRVVTNVYGVGAKYVSKYDDIDKLCSIDEAELPESGSALILIIGTDSLPEESAAVMLELHDKLKQAPDNAVIDTGISVDDAMEVIKAELLNPSSFWYDEEKGMDLGWSTGVAKYMFMAAYCVNANELQVMQEKLEERCAQIIQYARNTGNLDTPEKFAVFVSVWLKNHCEYRDKSISGIEVLDRTAYGALVDNVAICSGYTSAFNLLMLCAGYDAYYVEGESDEGIHAWSAYTGSDGSVIQCDPTQVSVDGKTGGIGWEQLRNFDGTNLDYRETMRMHYIIAK